MLLACNSHAQEDQVKEGPSYIKNEGKQCVKRNYVRDDKKNTVDEFFKLIIG